MKYLSERYRIIRKLWDERNNEHASLFDRNRCHFDHPILWTLMSTSISLSKRSIYRLWDFFRSHSITLVDEWRYALISNKKCRIFCWVTSLSWIIFMMDKYYLRKWFWHYCTYNHHEWFRYSNSRVCYSVYGTRKYVDRRCRWEWNYLWMSLRYAWFI